MIESHCVPGADTKTTNLTCLSRGESVGLFAATLAPLASLFAVSWLFCRIIANIHRMRGATRWRLVRLPIEVYLLSLFAGEFLESLGDTLNLNWVIYGQASSGAYCSAQGFIVTIGETAVALTTIAIAVHTFSVLWVDRNVRSLVAAWTVVGLLWTFNIVCSLVLLLRKPGFYVPTPYWCWVNAHKFLSSTLVVFYAWLWLAMIISFLGYLPLYLWRQGYIARDPDDPFWKFRVRRQQAHRYSYYMICYPLIYCILGLPLSVARWFQFEHKHVPPWITLASSFIFDLSGLCNVLLFIYTRTGLLLFENPGAAEGNADFLT